MHLNYHMIHDGSSSTKISFKFGHFCNKPFLSTSGPSSGQYQNDRYFLPKWPLLYQNDRYKLHQNDRYFYQNDRYLGPKWPLPKWPLWTKMTVIYKHQNDRYFVLKWPLCDQNNRYLDPKWSFRLTVILVFNNGHFGP